MATVKFQKWTRQGRYGAIALLSTTAMWGLVFNSAPGVAQSTAPLECLCESIQTDDYTQCLLDQRTQLNRAKNLARQRSEELNGGVSTIETEPSMHGPSIDSPYTIATSSDSIQYIFTFRVRPRATENYTYESQVAVNYATENNEWTVDTIYNRAIAPTAISYAETLAVANPEDPATCEAP